jgi:hypothetical protein
LHIPERGEDRRCTELCSCHDVPKVRRAIQRKMLHLKGVQAVTGMGQPNVRYATPPVVRPDRRRGGMTPRRASAAVGKDPRISQPAGQIRPKSSRTTRMMRMTPMIPTPP